MLTTKETREAGDPTQAEIGPSLNFVLKLSVEAFYQSQYAKWSTTALYVGCLVPVRKHFELDPYFVHQNITGKSPNQQLKQFGFTLNLYF